LGEVNLSKMKKAARWRLPKLGRWAICSPFSHFVTVIITENPKLVNALIPLVLSAIEGQIPARYNEVMWRICRLETSVFVLLK